MTDFLFNTFSAAPILERYRAAPGDEIGSRKMESPESSAALVANSFGFFMERPADLPPLPDWRGKWLPLHVLPEEEMRFPWRGGRHPWLDVLVETDAHFIGIESKRFEPFRTRAMGSFSSAFWRPGVWGPGMRPYEWMRDGLKLQPGLFRHLDAFQLVKHALGLRTQARARHKKPILVYLYAEPAKWPAGSGGPIAPEEHARHAEEARWFGRLVQGAEVEFRCSSYRALLGEFSKSKMPAIVRHAQMIEEAFGV